MEEVLLSAIAGLVMATATELSKVIKLPTQVVLAVLCVLAGVAYYFYTSYVPEATQTHIVALTAGSLGFATAIYNWLYKNIKK